MLRKHRLLSVCLYRVSAVKLTQYITCIIVHYAGPYILSVRIALKVITQKIHTKFTGDSKQTKDLFYLVPDHPAGVEYEPQTV
jgi:hypothetical protein